MLATGHGFVQQHEMQQPKGRSISILSRTRHNDLARVRPRVAPGLRWLTGHEGYDTSLDHPQYRIKDGLKTITARPYGLSLDQIEQLVALARQKSLRRYIWAPSNYNLDTVLIVLTEQSPGEGMP